jgi:hypothetical protein
MRFFYDTEFIDNGRTIELISIGVAAEDGREYYAISTEFDPERAGSWVRKNVLPKLPSPSSKLWRSRRQIRDDLETFFDIDGDQPIELWAWVSAYDHVVLCQLWGPMTDPTVHPRAASVLGGARVPAHATAAPRGARRPRRRQAQPAPISHHERTGDG